MRDRRPLDAAGCVVTDGRTGWACRPAGVGKVFGLYVLHRQRPWAEKLSRPRQAATSWTSFHEGTACVTAGALRPAGCVVTDGRTRSAAQAGWGRENFSDEILSIGKDRGPKNFPDPVRVQLHGRLSNEETVLSDHGTLGAAGCVGRDGRMHLAGRAGLGSGEFSDEILSRGKDRGPKNFPDPVRVQLHGRLSNEETVLSDRSTLGAAGCVGTDGRTRSAAQAGWGRESFPDEVLSIGKDRGPKNSPDPVRLQLHGRHSDERTVLRDRSAPAPRAASLRTVERVHSASRLGSGRFFGLSVFHRQRPWAEKPSRPRQAATSWESFQRRDRLA